MVYRNTSIQRDTPRETETTVPRFTGDLTEQRLHGQNPEENGNKSLHSQNGNELVKLTFLGNKAWSEWSVSERNPWCKDV